MSLYGLRARGRYSEGFTLVELLVIILIVGILAAIALPTFIGKEHHGQRPHHQKAQLNLGALRFHLKATRLAGSVHVIYVVKGQGRMPSRVNVRVTALGCNQGWAYRLFQLRSELTPAETDWWKWPLGYVPMEFIVAGWTGYAFEGGGPSGSFTLQADHYFPLKGLDVGPQAPRIAYSGWAGDPPRVQRVPKTIIGRCSR